jgi:prepilin-type N-terminal cleavage/methylation domain-containing protein
MPVCEIDMEASVINNQDGFTLIEGVMAIAIFAIGILAVGYMQLSAIKTNGSARMVTDAYTLASNKIEDFMTLPYDSGLSYALDNSSSKAGYSINQSVSLNSTVPETQRIDVTVLWRQRGSDRRLRLSHLRSEIVLPGG